MVLPDHPIKNKENDKLRRSPLAIKIAELIRNFKGKESFVIGIEGVWGSGKTSFINLVLNELRNDKGILFVHFNPWNFLGQNELIADFFTALHHSIRNENGTNGLAKTLRSYTHKLQMSFAPSIPIPYIGSIELGTLWRKGSITLQEEREEIDKQLNALSKKIIIVVDDIDRLDTNETRLVMKLVKMTANFPNTVFILAYDRDRVAKNLDSDGYGEEYLKKIIQESFTLPKPDEQGLRNILFSELEETIKGVYGEVKLEGEDKRRWEQIVYAGFPNFFATIRDINRYINSLRLNWTILGKDDINMIDFIAIEALRIFAPLLYTSISSNKTLFTGMENSYMPSTRNEQATKTAAYNRLLENVPEKTRHVVDKICHNLFPQISSGYGHDWQQSWRREKRICAEERFNFYFQLGIPEGAISEIEIDHMLRALNKKEDVAENLLKFQADKRLRPLLSKLLDYTDRFTENQAKNLIVTLWNLEGQIVDEEQAAFDFDNVETQMMRLSYHSIKNSIPKEKRGIFLKEIVEASRTLYPPTNFVTLLKQELKKEGRSEDEYLVQDVDTAEPIKILLFRIKEAAKNGTLSRERKLAFFLYRWRDWENENEVKKYVAELTKAKEGLLLYLMGFMGTIHSSTGNKKFIDSKVVVDFIPKENLDALIQSITDEEKELLSEKQKEAIILYRSPPKNDGWG